MRRRETWERRPRKVNGCIGIPTVYKGIQFRSRLEATWAAFFDILGWPWVFEPIDLPGYIPDFVLPWPSVVGIEAKPALKSADLYETQQVRKMRESGWTEPALIVGAGPLASEVFLGLTTLGIVVCGEETGSCPEAYMFRCKACNRHTFLTFQFQECFWCKTPIDQEADDTFDACPLYPYLWASARNLCQWMPPTMQQRKTQRMRKYEKTETKQGEVMEYSS